MSRTARLRTWGSTPRAIVGVILVTTASFGCSSDGNETPVNSATTTAPGREPADDSLAVYIEPGDFRADGVDQLLVERPIGAKPADVATPAVDTVGSPDVSSDGLRVAYVAFVDGAETGQIWLSSLDELGRDPIPVTEESDGWWCPRWMPDSRHLLAFHEGSGGQLVLVDTESGDFQAIETNIPADEMAYCADPSPTGQEVAVARDTGEYQQNEVWAISVDGGDERALGTLPERCIINDVAWSPADSVVAADAICEQKAFNGIWLVTTNGEEPSQLVGDNPAGGPELGSVQYWEPAWDSTGSRIFFHRNLTTQQGEEPVPPSIWEVAVPGGSSSQIINPASVSASAGPA